MKVFELLEGAMPSSVIKHKEAMAQKTPEQMHKDFKEVSSRTGKSVKDLALSAARRHGHGDGSTKYWDKIKHLEEDSCRVCGQTPCNCTYIVESQDFANMGTAELKRYVDRHVKNGIAHELSKDAKAKLKAAQQELNRRTNLSEGEAERKTNAIWAQITDYEKRAKATKDPIKKDHYVKMARESERRRGVNEDVTEGVKPNMRGVEAELAAHAQRKIDYEKENGPMVAHELFSHEQRRKQLMKKLSRERSKANNS